MRGSKEYTVIYSGMKGVDFEIGGGGSKSRYAYLENMYTDYERGGELTVESIPGYRKIASLDGRINGIFFYTAKEGETAVVHAGTGLYAFAVNDRDSLYDLERIAEVKDVKSCSFTDGGNLYVCDGESIVRIDENVSAGVVGRDIPTYLPTTFINGEAYEQANLLSDKFTERFTVVSADEIAYGSDPISYRITSEEEMTCAVSGVVGSFEGDLYVPPIKVFGDRVYTVTSVSHYAFAMQDGIRSVYLPYTLKSIDDSAFYGCTYLERVVTGTGIRSLGSYAFDGCLSLSELYLGRGCEYVGDGCFEGVPGSFVIYYEGTPNEFLKVKQYGALNGIEAVYNTVYTQLCGVIPVYTDASDILTVKAAGKEIDFDISSVNGRVVSVSFTVEDKSQLNGVTFTIFGRRSTYYFGRSGQRVRERGDGLTEDLNAILGCRISERFDGRIFLSGNPTLPGTVFYSARNSEGKNDPTYFAESNYFHDGGGIYGVSSMLSLGDSLAVFKEGDEGEGSIFYHTPKETGSDLVPKVYPVSYVHTGTPAYGPSISFYDDPIFISSLGISALGKRAINLERSISVRSHNVNALLLCKDPKSFSLTKWKGYLVCLSGDEAYLADSRATFIHRTQNTEYEWYYLKGLGSFRSDRQAFRYATHEKEGLVISDKCDMPVTQDVYSYTDQLGERVYYTEEDGTRYHVTPTGERVRGEFYPATVIRSSKDDILFFGTECGDLMVFNSDKRGVAPPWASEEDKSEYERYGTRLIHPAYYSFADHAVRYTLRTAKDNCGIPYLTKNTVKGSLAVKIKQIGKGGFTLEVGTEKEGYREEAKTESGTFCFLDLDFSAIEFGNDEYTILPFGEKRKGWIEKDINLYSEDYLSPFGISSIVYRFTPGGRIKSK